MTATANGEDRLRQTLARVLGVTRESLSDESSPENTANWDSLNHLNLVMALEGEFGVSFSPEDALDMRNVGLIRTILRDSGVEV